MSTIYQIKVEAPPESTRNAEQAWPEEASPLHFRAADGSYYLGHRELCQVRARGCSLEVVREIPLSEIPVRIFMADQGVVTDPPPERARLAVLARLLSEERADGSTHIRYLGRNRSVPPDGFVQDCIGGDRHYVWQSIEAERSGRPALFDRFKALRACFLDPDTKVVLSLGSGGLKLFAHATVIRLLETLDCSQHVDEIWGSSAGAVAGLLYSHGLSPQAIEQSGYDLYAGRYDLALRPTKLQLLRHLLRDTFLPSREPGAAGLVDCSQGLARVLDQYCSTFHPRRPFFCIAFNLAECRPEVLTPLEVPEHLREFMSQTDPREAVLASSTVPLLFVPRRIQRAQGEIPYIDGSTTEDVPLYSPTKKWDLDREAGVERRERLLILYVKLTSSMAQYRTRTGHMGKLRLLQTVASAGIDTMHKRQLELLSLRTDVRAVGLHLMDSTPDFFETRRIPEFIRSAKETFPNQLEAIDRQLRNEDPPRGSGA